jgi:ABC-2 type transport system permease protein
MKSLRDMRWQMLGFGLALAALAAIDVFLWPTYKDQLALVDLPPALEALLGSDLSLATPAGFLNAEYFAWIIILPLVFAVIQGTGAIAGEEGAGTLDLWLAQPLRRQQFVAERVGAFLIAAAGMFAIACLGWLVSVPWVDLGSVTLVDTLVATANMIFVTVFFYGLALWLGAVAPTRGHAAGAAIALITGAYFADSVAAGVDALSWLRYVSPFYYYGRGLPLIDGINWWHAALLTALGAAFIALTMRTLDRRDITLGGASELRMADLVRRVVG